MITNEVLLGNDKWQEIVYSGVDDGVLTAILSYVKREGPASEPSSDQAEEKTESLEIRVDGSENIEPGASASGPVVRTD